MRSIFCILIALLYGQYSVAQNKQLLYGVESLPQSLLLNPGAATSFDKHIGVPFFSGFYASAGSSGVSVDDLFREGSDFNIRIREVISSLSNTDFFTVNQQTELVSIGWKSKFKERYYSAGIYQELDFILYFPKDLAVLGLEGNADFIGTAFDFSDLSTTAELLSVYHFGISQKINKKLRLGARGKLYSSILNANSARNQGIFITTETPDGPNFLSHDIRSADVVLNTSGLRSLSDGDASGTGLISRTLFSGNIGLGFDVGGTYTVNDKVTLTASLLDVGFIFHSTDTRNYQLKGDFSFQGVNFQFPAILDGESTVDYFQNLQDDFLDQLNYEDDLSESYITLRPVKINAAINYGFGFFGNQDCDCFNDETFAKNNIGLQLYTIKRPQGFQGAVTGYYDLSLSSFLRTKVSYTVDPFSTSNLGVLLSTRINKFNFYIAAENVLDYTNIAKARNAAVQFGFQLLFNENY